MANPSYPSIDQLNQLLRYDLDSNKLYWRDRPEEFFKDGPRDKQHSRAVFNATFSGTEAFTAVNGNGYQSGSILGVSIPAHVVIWAMATGAYPEAQIDHIDGNRLNNALSNLRPVTPLENARNAKRRHDCTSGQTGVSLYRPNGKWRAYVYVGGKMAWCKYYETKEEAIAARLKAQEDAGFHPNHGRSDDRRPIQPIITQAARLQMQRDGDD